MGFNPKSMNTSDVETEEVDGGNPASGLSTAGWGDKKCTHPANYVELGVTAQVGIT
jgi:hypothetical protein